MLATAEFDEINTPLPAFSLSTTPTIIEFVLFAVPKPTIVLSTTPFKELSSL